MTKAAAQSELQCPACAGQRVFSPDEGALTCLQCGQTAAIDYDPGDAATERPYPEPFDPPVEADALVHHCETCGGDVVFTGPALSQSCAYCNGPVVRRVGDKGFETMALIPFRVAEDTAQQQAQKWVGRRLAAPRDLSDVVAKARVAGLYAPFWTFDSDEAVAYTARYRVRSGDRTSWRSTSGAFKTSFDDLLVPASPHITPLIRDGILHDFEPGRLRPYRPAYLSGFAAERHHQTLSEGLAALEEDKDVLIRNQIKRHINRSSVSGIDYKTDTSGVRYRRILLPVWMLHYEYGGIPMKVVVCGIEGRAFGERPFSTPKLAVYAALLSAAAIAAGILWGGMAAP